MLSPLARSPARPVVAGYRGVIALSDILREHDGADLAGRRLARRTA